MATYPYAQTAPAAVPAGYQYQAPRPDPDDPLHALAVHGVWVYARRLTPEETRAGHLALILDAAGEQEALTHFIDRAWQLYPEGPARLLRFAADAPDWFRRQVGSQFGRFYPGHPPVVRNLAVFTARLLAALREELP